MIHISLSGEVLFYMGALPVTNTLLTTWLVMLFLTFGSFIFTQNLRFIPGLAQVAVEGVVDGLHATFKSILDEKVNQFFPLLATLFLFIIISNWSGLLPGVGTIGIKKQITNAVTSTHSTEPISQTEQTEVEEHSSRPFDIPLFRAPTADLNTTLALSIIAMAMLQYWGMEALGSLNYLGKFITFKDPISFFVGLLEFISEVGKVISFTFRLFGNIFAGEVLLVIVGSLIPIIAPLPFIGLEIFVGFIQALVFSMLLAVFLSIATTQTHH
ncbi:MAG: ATP synthase subunit a, F-type H+-transporting ATPase subunit a [Microgenomates group bacterium GW2011_GWC1_41_8]|uniref:ATP synthase subunit a n=2 Tax=Candidatus Roizmaniibacteriota TaxID=1752723 RepID=A0A0G0TA55_9BACT|nr:MAG: ATP synthase subunit a [Candidatus Levybacteria bacterium GW2011_GWA2_40_16]KKR71671.1 MAG: ATP synthase subunit a [Candidatus Roizmanbacteria bacterium GW2011_GWB1_40_7]KKR93997.1 MAG: ATP synthase subunit a [Candidatus Roizmanbacteria bacterium GW2011_GWA1_41_13]KKS23302.1 MAG: ATP synthase subunit a, F-type H+-transporting ATPase subunit a [Microgenomates group bacterium GW2011_GWC1_41_8]OGK48466.1 MAG: ATP synthase F0 subunit A [Candidatus Roizmanbacteria bacterium RIFCSPLOWO2_01_FU